ncbi:cell wall metabolism sensor histidine kinase WalK [Enterococcus dongliensis]|uniref:histidine kinase n=1 Tax=Enterococcus dongliensis TaxID=2559925 RepID=A0AAP5KUZ1_9ENTE|nr:cell wall metabolism sensor histidine kinase WalK [Enterococcus dongliensis]MDT2595563.1 cell wall metabolism sensor histidine kinase WalK [Enterococcus dongliensis]MDT2603221.1 cell wall metabolism sensor histidine kinase WalK [Enterococcus dongliensis]MDT2613166.1 cell wall metabolism sensor histidine kinase WalK [Enterococcus dongliensis]MDT2633584.1 cell wall metabolism sensor histidine kinase WalK [Enterococcus dongliensis]MDT2636042.1 cell wall metabolism sensor histidine kinase WalK 
MEKKVRFYRSVNFKIAFSFILILLISIEIIGAYFIRGLEKSTIDNFTKDMNQRVSLLSTTLGTAMAEDSENEGVQLQRILENNTAADITEMWVVDDKGIVIATNDVGQKDSIVGKKNEYSDIDDFSIKQYVTLDDNNKRVCINVQPIQSPTGDSAVIGALYVKSDIEQKYTEISNTALIFFTASLIAGLISIVVSLLVARSITKPIKEMQKQAVRIAQGDYSEKVDVQGHDELSQLAETFNKLSDRIEDAQDTMEAERNRLDSVLTHMTDGVIATDRRGKVITINEMALSLLDTTSEQAIGQSILTLLDLEEEYTLRKLLETPDEILIDRSKSELEEDRMTLRSDFAMIRRESGFISGLVVVLHDVTEQEKTAEERRQFVSNVSHELRTPLTSVRSYLEALEEGVWKDENVAPQFIHVTLGETDRMIRMINDLLNLSRMDSGAQQLDLELVNFNELVDYALDRFDMMVNNQEKNYRIVREFTERDLWVEIDTDKIMQVIDNIMNNAIKYSPDGGKIEVHLMETHNNVVLSISDEGLGIPKKDLEKVFERFYRVDKARARQQGGTGLGLAISKEVMKAHQGQIWVESVEGKGSTFYISLPYEPYEEDIWE